MWKNTTLRTLFYDMVGVSATQAWWLSRTQIFPRSKYPFNMYLCGEQGNISMAAALKTRSKERERSEIKHYRIQKGRNLGGNKGRQW